METLDDVRSAFPAEYDIAVAQMMALPATPDQPAAWVRELCRRIQAGSPPDAAAQRIPANWSA